MEIQSKLPDSSGNPTGINYTGSYIELSYPHSYMFFGSVIRLLVPGASYNNQIYVKNRTLSFAKTRMGKKLSRRDWQPDEVFAKRNSRILSQFKPGLHEGDGSKGG